MTSIALHQMSNEQEAIIAFLKDPASYGGTVDTVDVMETHGALVFLAGDDVYKIKRAVTFDYMDFSKLGKRHQVCEREFELNKPAAPTLYLGVVPITQEEGGALKINGQGEPVEWAVHMRRFDQDKLFTSLARSHHLSHATLKLLAAEIARYHRRASIGHSDDGKAPVEGIIKELDDAFRALPGAVHVALVDRFVETAKRHLAQCADTLNARARKGLIRRCHGDLHLGNIVLLDDKPVLFDALEFDESLAITDLLYEIAFLVMDLWHEGLRVESNLLLNRYIYETSDLNPLDGLRALPLFMALRAGIRAMVSAQRAAQKKDGQVDRCTEAKAFLHDALRFLTPAPARLIAVGGFSGTGKSTLAAELAAHVGPVPGAIHIRSDLERKILFGVSETERLDETCYTPDASKRVYGAVCAKAASTLAAGHAVIADAVFSDDLQRRDIETVARQLGVPFTGLWLTASEDDLVARVDARCGDASDATADTVRSQLAKPTPRSGWHEVDASGSPLETVISAQIVLRQDDALTFDEDTDAGVPAEQTSA